MGGYQLSRQARLWNILDVNGPLINTLTWHWQCQTIKLVNTPRLAYLTGGAVYDINNMTSEQALDAFGRSIGEVLGSLLYELLS